MALHVVVLADANVAHAKKMARMGAVVDVARADAGKTVHVDQHVHATCVVKSRGSEVMQTVTAQELKKKMEETSSLLVINVLSPDAFKDCSITGSINIPVAELEKQSKEWPKHKKIVVYCAHDKCPASRNAYDLLTKLGFQNVFAYEGGIKDWYQKGLPTRGACQADFLK